MDQLLEDKTARNLLYIEALWSVDQEQVEVMSEARSSLAALRKKAMKKEVGGAGYRLVGAAGCMLASEPYPSIQPESP